MQAITDKWMETAQVVSNREIAPGIFDLTLRTGRIADAARPGQFVSVYCDDGARLLPRPISVCGADDGLLRLVFRVAGEGTREFSRKKPGEYLRVLGPLGNGYAPEAADGKTIVLTGGGIGIPPLLFAAKVLRERMEAAASGGDGKTGSMPGTGETGAMPGGRETGSMPGPARICAVLGYRDGNAFLADEFAKYGSVYIATEDGSLGTKGTVLTCMEENGLCPDVIFACGPTPMLRALKEAAAREGTECYLSLEERMACGVGACLSCVCATAEEDAHSKVRNTRICREGPVFPADRVIL